MKLKNLRVSKGFTVSGLARASGVDKALISKIETGERTSFRPDTMKKIADALQVGMPEVEEFAEVMRVLGEPKAAKVSNKVLAVVSS